MPNFLIADRCECGTEHSIGADTLAACTTHMAAWWTQHLLKCTVERSRAAREAREAEEATQLAARNAVRAERDAARRPTMPAAPPPAAGVVP